MNLSIYHQKLPLTIYTTRDKIRLYFVDFTILFSLLIHCREDVILQWKEGGLSLVIGFYESLM